MKQTLLVVLAVFLGCSDDGIYTPIGTEQPETLCEQRDEQCDGGTDADDATK
jgi:hypothetical protein